MVGWKRRHTGRRRGFVLYVEIGKDVLFLNPWDGSYPHFAPSFFPRETDEKVPIPAELVDGALKYLKDKAESRAEFDGLRPKLLDLLRD